MNRVWALCLATLWSCGAHTATSTLSTPSSLSEPVSADRATPVATRPPVPGASDPHECEDAPSSEPKPSATPLLEDNALVGLDACTHALTGPGNLGITAFYKGDGSEAKVLVNHSTVHDCRVVGCIKELLTKVLRSSTTSTKGRAMQNVQLALVPRAAVRSVKHVDWPIENSSYCADSDDELAEFKAGHLPPELIQKTIRERYADFRKCYEGGLASNPHLSGRIALRFVIEQDGHVSTAYVQDNELPDCGVSQCVRSAMAKIVFPKPDHGKVTVVYPIMFAPG